MALTPEQNRSIQLAKRKISEGDAGAAHDLLKPMVASNLDNAELLSLFGAAVALGTGRVHEGKKYALAALKVEAGNSGLYLNLARIYNEEGDRKKAVATLRKGLGCEDPDPEVLVMLREIGVRERPPLPFLKRSNPLNVAIGRVRHSLKRKKSKD